MQGKIYRNYLRSYHMIQTTYHMVQVRVMNISDNQGPDAVFKSGLMDLVDYLLSVIEYLESIMEYYDTPDNVPDWFNIDSYCNSCWIKLNKARGVIGADPYINDTGLSYKIQGTAAEIMKHYVK